MRRVLAAANAEFTANGFHTAQITRIAHEAEVSVGALYRFFPDKAALATALRDRYLEEAAEGYRAMLDNVSTPEDVLPTFVSVLRFAASLQKQHTGYYRLTLDQLPEEEVSWAFSVREQMVQDFSSAIRSVGLDAVPNVEDVFGFVIEQVHSVLAKLPVDDTSRDAHIAQLERMVGLYIADRFGLDATALDP